MKKTISSILALLFAAPLASAQPWHHDDRHGDYDRRSDEGYRDNRAMVLSARTFADSSQQEINLGGEHQRFDRLRIEPVKGRPLIRHVTIEYADQSTQMVDVGRPQSDLIIPLNHRELPVYRIIVYTYPNRGSYRVIGER